MCAQSLALFIVFNLNTLYLTSSFHLQLHLFSCPSAFPFFISQVWSQSKRRRHQSLSRVIPLSDEEATAAPLAEREPLGAEIPAELRY